jgi:hypothetical protein
LAKVKSEELFLRTFWLPHYSKFFEHQDLHVHSDGSLDGTEKLCRDAGVNLTVIPPGIVQHGKNNLYIVEVITKLLESYDCVLFAESPDDIIIPGPMHSHNLNQYIDAFMASPDVYRFLTCYNVTHRVNAEPDYDPANGLLLTQRNAFIRCPQYDNPFLWKSRPTWGRGWHDLIGVNDGKRICGGGDMQGDDKRLYNIHIHYADFRYCNARHKVRQATYSAEERLNNLYSCQVDDKLRSVMQGMLDDPKSYFADGIIQEVPVWMKTII